VSLEPTFSAVIIFYLCIYLFLFIISPLQVGLVDGKGFSKSGLFMFVGDLFFETEDEDSIFLQNSC
jgi:hypothetical protein